MTEPQESKFARQVFIAVGIVVLTILLLVFLYFTFDVLLLTFAAILVAVFLRGLASALGRVIKISEKMRVLLVSVMVLAVLAGAIALLAPNVADQIQNLREELPRSAQTAGAYLSQFGWGRAVMEHLPSVDDITNNFVASDLLVRVGGIFSSTVGAIANFFLMLLLAVYLALEPQFYLKGFALLFPINYRQRVGEVLAEIGETLSWWLIGKAASMLFIGLLTWIGLSIIGVPLALTLGLTAGLLSFIPNFGPIISAVPAVLLAFIDSPKTSLYVMVLYIGVQLIESNIVTPLIERETIEIPPAATIVFQLSMAVLVGGVGLILATPLLAVILVIIQMVYIQDVLGDKDMKTSGEEAAAQT